MIFTNRSVQRERVLPERKNHETNPFAPPRLPLPADGVILRAERGQRQPEPDKSEPGEGRTHGRPHQRLPRDGDDAARRLGKVLPLPHGRHRSGDRSRNGDCDGLCRRRRIPGTHPHLERGVRRHRRKGSPVPRGTRVYGRCLRRRDFPLCHRPDRKGSPPCRTVRS